MNEADTRELLATLGASLFARGYSVGSAGNISVRLADGYLMTPTNSCLGRLEPARISKLDAGFAHVAGDPPSKDPKFFAGKALTCASVRSSEPDATKRAEEQGRPALG